MRWVMTRVLPVPAPARTSSGPSVVVTASRCGGLRPERSTGRRRRIASRTDGAAKLFARPMAASPRAYPSARPPPTSTRRPARPAPPWLASVDASSSKSWPRSARPSPPTRATPAATRARTASAARTACSAGLRGLLPVHPLLALRAVQQLQPLRREQALPVVRLLRAVRELHPLAPTWCCAGTSRTATTASAAWACRRRTSTSSTWPSRRKEYFEITARLRKDLGLPG